MLVAILVLAKMHHSATGVWSFSYFDLLGTELSANMAYWLMLGFFIAFVVKLPGFPFHTWLPDAHTQAPTAGSVILAGILLKTGAYGLIRFTVPLFPVAALEFAPIAMFPWKEAKWLQYPWKNIAHTAIKWVLMKTNPVESLPTPHPKKLCAYCVSSMLLNS